LLVLFPFYVSVYLGLCYVHVFAMGSFGEIITLFQIEKNPFSNRKKSLFQYHSIENKYK